MRNSLTLALLTLTTLTACESLYPPTPKPDHTIRVMPTENGLVAVPPDCLNWSKDTMNPYDNQVLPQFGCANARNLAMMVEKPEDLLKGRDGGKAIGVTTVGAMHRYYNNQTRGLIWTSETDPNSVATTTAPSAASPLTGEIVSGGVGSSSSSSPSSSSSTGP